MSDDIKHPDYYNWHPSGVECATITDAFNFNLGNVIKYAWRCGHKHPDPVQDLKKAREYLDREIVRLTNRPGG